MRKSNRPIDITFTAVLTSMLVIGIGSTTPANGQVETDQEYEVYESDCCGFTIMYPRGWFVDDSLSLESYKEIDAQTPWTADPDVEFEAPALAIKGESEEPQSPAALGVAVVDAIEQLDPNDMTMKTITPHDLAVANLQELRKYVILSIENITKDGSTTFGLGNYSGWRADMVTSQNDIVSGNSCCRYHIDIFSATTDKVYKISGFTREIVAERYLPILQKMIDSFRITEPKPTPTPTQTQTQPNSTSLHVPFGAQSPSSQTPSYIADEDMDTKAEYQEVCAKYPDYGGCVDENAAVVKEVCATDPDVVFCPITEEDNANTNTNTEDEDEDDIAIGSREGHFVNGVWKKTYF